MPVLFKVPATLSDLTEFIFLCACYWLAVIIGEKIADLLESSIKGFGGQTAKTMVYHWLPLYVLGPRKNLYLDLLWGSLVIPIIEDLLFFALPLVTVPELIWVTPAVFAFAHVLMYYEGMRTIGAPRSYARRVFIAETINYLPSAYAAAALWMHGYGYMSVLFHIIINTAAHLKEFQTYRSFEEAYRQIEEEYRRPRQKPFAEGFA